jgi:hypothetical protein
MSRADAEMVQLRAMPKRHPSVGVDPVPSHTHARTDHVLEPWEETDSALGIVSRTALEVNLLTEDNLPDYHLALWDTFGRGGAWASGCASRPPGRVGTRSYSAITSA